MLFRKWGLACLGALLVGSICFVVPALADEFSLVPSITQDLKYDDNVFVAPSGQTHDFISYTVGGLRLIDRTERLNLNVSSRIAQSLYKDNSGLDATDLLNDGTIVYSLTPKLSLSGKASYLRDSQPGRDLETTGLVLSRTRRERYSLGAGASYNLTEKTLASLSYDRGTTNYSSNALRSSDFTSDLAGLSFQHDLTKLLPSTKGTLNLNYGQYAYTGLDVRSYSATTGIIYAIQEKWSIQAAAGARRTDSEFSAGRLSAGSPGATETSWGTVGQASLNYTGETTNGSFSFSRDVAPASGQAGTTERTSFALSASRRFTYELRGLFSTSYFINKSSGTELSTSPLDTRTINVTPGIRYDFSKDMFLEASYSFSRVENKQAETTADRNLFLVRFFFQRPFLE